jgi:hypothetical protein
MKVLSVVAVFVLLLSAFFVNRKDTPFRPLSTRAALDRDGICQFRQILGPAQVSQLKALSVNNDSKVLKEYIHTCPAIVDTIRSLLGPDYAFHDYSFIIKKSSIHTCHRDANGDLFNEGQQWPSYTVLIYFDGGALGVVPGSNDGRALNLTGGLRQVASASGDMILFDANLVHAGAIGDDNVRLQLKVSHVDDHKVLDFYQGYNKVADRPNTHSFALKKVHQQLSCLAPALADMTQSEVKEDTNSMNKKVFSALVYGDPNFYDLPDTN